MRREKMVSLASRETWVSRVTGESWACSDPEERTGLRVLRVDRVPTVSPVLLVLLGRRANWVFQDCQATQEDKALRVLLDSQDSLGPMERREPGVWQANQVQGGNEVQRVHVVLGVQEVLLESQGQRAQRAMMVHQARLAREDLKDPRAPWVSQDRRAPLDHLERTGCLVTLASVVRRVSKGRPDHQDLPELLAHRDPLVRLAPSAREDIRDPLALLESRDFLVLLAKRALRETPVPRELLEKMAPLG